MRRFHFTVRLQLAHAGSTISRCVSSHVQADCHCTQIKKIDGPIKETQENPRSNFYIIFGSNLRKKSYFSSKKPDFSRKNSFLSAKISDDLFFSHFEIFAFIFKFSPFFGPKSTTNSLL